MRGVSRVLKALKLTQRWPLWIRLTVTGLAVGAAYLFQIPLERNVPGEPFLLFLLVVIGTTLAFGARIGLVCAGLSTFLSIYFFEPVGTPTLTYASDLVKIELYAILAIGTVFAFAYLGTALTDASDKTEADRNKSILLRELTHGVANNFAAVAALIDEKSLSVSDSKAKSVLNDAIAQVRVMARVHRLLRAGRQEVSLDSKAFVQQLCDDLKASMARGRPIAIECRADSRPLCMDQAVSMGLIINELVTNATKHAFPGHRSGRIRVGFEDLEDQMQLSIEDDGAGFEGSYRNGIGQDLVRALSRDLGGELRVKSTRSGSTFSLRFPYVQPNTARTSIG
jgi:two-component sensor histidine kinase